MAAAARAAPAPVQSVEVNAFNRLLKPAARVNRPAVDSGIHDAGNDMTLQLQPAEVACGPGRKSPAGKHGDWVEALSGKDRGGRRYGRPWLEAASSFASQ